MKVLITGTSKGIGKAIAEIFLKNNHHVIGFDILDATIKNKNYIHYKIDIFRDKLITINDIDILINNAGVQNSDSDIDINLKGTIRITEEYAIKNKNIKSVLFIASSSARTGSEFPLYAASKAGIVGYMKNVTLRLGENGVIVNSLSPGGVYTSINERVIKDAEKFKQIMDLTLLKKWSFPEEIATWAYFITVINKSMTGQDILIDNGEECYHKFIW